MLQYRLSAGPDEAKDPQLFRDLKERETEIRDVLNSPEYALGRAFRRDARSCGGFTRLSRCEMLLERGFYRFLNELRTLQAIRQEKKCRRQNEPTDAAAA